MVRRPLMLVSAAIGLGFAVTGCSRGRAVDLTGTWQGTEYIPDPKTGKTGTPVPVSITFGPGDAYSVTTRSSIGTVSGDGTYAVEGDRLRMSTNGSSVTSRFTVSGRTLTIDAVASGDPPAVLTKQ